ncbi:MAG: hypothetical protein IPO15_25890 [Anaerolineae bacterium]|nr:hypothetical protein [Anaerolineae bacterium]
MGQGTTHRRSSAGARRHGAATSSPTLWPGRSRNGPGPALLTAGIENNPGGSERDASEAPDSDLFVEIPTMLRSVPAMPPRGNPDAEPARGVRPRIPTTPSNPGDEAPLDKVDVPPDAPLAEGMPPCASRRALPARQPRR